VEKFSVLYIELILSSLGCEDKVKLIPLFLFCFVFRCDILHRIFISPMYFNK